MSPVIIIGVIIMLNGCASTTPDNDHIADIIPVSGPFVPVNAVAVRRVADPPLVDGQPSRPRQPNMFTNGSGWRSKPRGYVRLDPPKPPPAGSVEAQPEAAQPSDTKAEATSTGKASDELSDEALEAVAGGDYSAAHYFIKYNSTSLSEEHPDRSLTSEIGCFWLAALAVVSGHAADPAPGRNPAEIARTSAAAKAWRASPQHDHAGSAR